MVGRPAARLVIDWQPSHTVAAIRLGEAHAPSRRWPANAAGPVAPMAPAVSQALSAAGNRFGITAAVVYDRPSAAFTRSHRQPRRIGPARERPSLGADRLPLVVV
jgi:hypothetical protein